MNTYHNYHDYCFHSIFTENWLQAWQTVVKCGEVVMISDDCHNITRLLLLAVIVNSDIDYC